MRATLSAPEPLVPESPAMDPLAEPRSAAGVLPLRWVAPVFFASGFSALLYQTVWQRALFTHYGTNVESVTVIVTAFMVGLGAGSLLGGVYSQDPRRPALLAFCLVEAAIGLFGLVSLSLIEKVGALTLGMGTLGTGVVSLLLVLVPTTLMGATLPVLVAFAVRLWGNVGRSVGALYFVNTLGSAAASFAAAFFVMSHLGQAGTVRLAAGLNLGVALLVSLLLRRGRA